MIDPAEAVLGILRSHVSAPTARSVLDIARLRAGVAAGPLRPSDLETLVDPLASGLRLFLPDAEAIRICRTKLAELAKRSAPRATAPTPQVAASLTPAGGVATEFPPGTRKTMTLTAEDDLGPARSLARRIASSVFASVVWQTRVVTITSELARNIVQYAGHGEISIQVLESGRGLEVIATDRGPGIPHLDSVLGGTHRSHSGMGQGLRGVKAVCEEFEIRADRGQGTYVRARLKAQ